MKLIRQIPIHTMGLTQILNFWRKVDKSGDCWIWTGSKSEKGYGQFGITTAPHTTPTFPAHRVAYALAHGTAPTHLQLDHTCRNTSCVNPQHLEPVTNRVNTLRGNNMAARHARKVNCDNGHPLDRPDYRGGRRCRQCHTDRQRKYRQNKSKGNA